MAVAIPGALAARIKEIPVTDVSISLEDGSVLEEEDVIEDFALFIDTHRDQPHIGSFHNDIHRGECRPTLVHYEPSGDMLIEASTGKYLARHEKHMFITADWFSSWLVERMMNGEGDPRTPEGVMATSHLRDPRAKVYQVRSFRQIIMDRWAATRP